jgi:hypothetical protein
MFPLFTDNLSSREYVASNGRFSNRQRVGNDIEESLTLFELLLQHLLEVLRKNTSILNQVRVCIQVPNQNILNTNLRIIILNKSCDEYKSYNITKIKKFTRKQVTGEK